MLPTPSEEGDGKTGGWSALDLFVGRNWGHLEHFEGWICCALNSPLMVIYVARFVYFEWSQAWWRIGSTARCVCEDVRSASKLALRTVPFEKRDVKGGISAYSIIVDEISGRGEAFYADGLEIALGLYW